jgi:hypothetical protein
MSCARLFFVRDAGRLITRREEIADLRRSEIDSPGGGPGLSTFMAGLAGDRRVELAQQPQAAAHFVDAERNWGGCPPQVWELSQN